MKSFSAVAALVAFLGCSVNSAKNHYILAEKFWSDGKYAAAVAEFDKVIARDPKGKFGIQALLRAASTQAFFLGQYSDAVKKFKLFTERSKDEEAVWDAQKQIGEILYAKTEQYDQAIPQYQRLLELRPRDSEGSEFLFRIGKSQFYSWKFKEAIQTYGDLIRRFPNSAQAEQALFETGVTQLTRGEQQNEGHAPDSYKEAIQTYKRYLEKYPKGSHAIEAKFGIASCLEEMDQLDLAYQAYESLLQVYPSPNVVKIKLARIRERIRRRSH